MKFVTKHHKHAVQFACAQFNSVGVEGGRVLAPGGEGFEGGFGLHALAGVGVDVGCVRQQSTGHELAQGEGALSAGMVEVVLGEAPAGVEGGAVTDNLFLAEQRFKAGEGGHDVDLFDGVEEVAHGDVGDDGVAGGKGLGLEGAARAETGGDIGMGFVEEKSVRMGGAHGLEESEVGADGLRAELERGVGLDLAWDEEEGFGGGRGGPEGGADVVFGEVEGEDAVDEVLGALEEGFWEGVVLEEVFEGGGGRGVVVDADGVEDPGEGFGEACAKADGAEEAVLEAEDVGVGGELAGADGAGEGGVEGAAPGDEGGAGRDAAEGADKGEAGLW